MGKPRHWDIAVGFTAKQVSEIQYSEAEEKKDSKKAKELFQKIGELGKKLGPEYVALMDGLQDIDPEGEVGAEITSAFRELDRKCTR